MHACVYIQTICISFNKYTDRPIRSADLAHIQELLKEMAEERELEEDHSQEMCIDQNGEHGM